MRCGRRFNDNFAVPMIEFIQITNDPALARRCDALEGMRLFVDLERLGKAQRQAGRNTFISVHGVQDVGRIREAVRRTPLMVRVNPLHPSTVAEVDAVVALGADLLMLPMFTRAAELREFAAIVAGRVPVVPLLETHGALESLEQWIDTPGLVEVFVGLNDLHVSMGQTFMFEPLALGLVEHVAKTARRHELRFGFGGVARLDEGLLPGRDVLAEHIRLGSGSVILSRTFHRANEADTFEADVASLRRAERELAQRSASQVESDARRIANTIRDIAAVIGRAA
jgi:HpcH/HpaI aldolase/citrate lyase family